MSLVAQLDGITLCGAGFTFRGTAVFSFGSADFGIIFTVRAFALLVIRFLLFAAFPEFPIGLNDGENVG